MLSRPILVSMAILTAATAGLARTTAEAPDAVKRTGPFRTLVIDGSPVHDVGELLLHTANWGSFGSYPGASYPFSGAPSAEWPAGSGVEYVFAGGLWIGAIRHGVPAVSTSAFEMEFRPTPEPIDVVYRSVEGTPNGLRYPSPGADDDGDGTVDEEALDGHDNDSDGAVDEDFAAISRQMFSRWYTDDEPVAQQIYPPHNPLHLMVRENSYQWDLADYDDFVGFDYEITNIGTDVLEDVYVGVFLDGDVGRRSTNNYWTDDAAAFRSVPLVCTEYGPVSYDYAYVYDADGDNGTANGYFGVVILDHPTDPTGSEAPTRVGASTFANFSGSASFEEGGDPTNDFERYELLSSETIERDGTPPADYRTLVVVGPFRELDPGATIKFSTALVATPRAGAFENVINAVLTYKGRWFDVDGDPTTGVDGRETPVPGPVENIVIDPCRPGYDQPIDWNSREPIWINTDCEAETACQAEGKDFRTGIDGREQQVHWWPPTQEVPGPVPVMAGVRFTPRTINLESVGDPLNARVTLPEGYHAGDVADATLRLNDVIPGQIQTIVSDREFVAQFARKRLHEVVGAGEVELRVSFVAANQPFMASDRVRVIHGGGPAPASENVRKTMWLSHSPNPFNPSARVVFELPEGGDVNLDVFSADGTLVRRLASGAYAAGRHDVSWDGRDDSGRGVASGIYFCRLVAGGEVLTKKMVMVK